MVTHTHAAVLAVGDELVIGQKLDTNSRWISQRLLDRGIEVVEHATVGDDLPRLTEAMGRLASRVPLLIVTGGLGPTADDLTREAMAGLLGEGLELDEAAWSELQEKIRARGRAASDSQRTQALRPRSAVCLRNPVGTAPGLWATWRSGEGRVERMCDVACLPGPPRELQAVWEDSEGGVASRLRPQEGRSIGTKLLQFAGLAESDAGDALQRAGNLMDRGRNPLVGITASSGVLTVRIRGEGRAGEIDRAVEETSEHVIRAMGDHLFAEGEVSLAEAVLCRMRSEGRKLSVVESCTGGLLGATVTRIAGASDVFVGGFLTYSNELKRRLVGVSESSLAEHGAVSRQVAEEMAVGGMRATGSTDALSVTGIAGPDGGSESKPVGTVWIGHAHRGEGGEVVSARCYRIPGTRDDVRLRSVNAALTVLVLTLRRSPALLRRWLWQVE